VALAAIHSLLASSDDGVDALLGDPGLSPRDGPGSCSLCWVGSEDVLARAHRQRRGAGAAPRSGGGDRRRATVLVPCKACKA
jgi:hypothetical protein